MSISDTTSSIRCTGEHLPDELCCPPKQQYCTDSPDFFNNWTSIDRQTELNDDDGTLTGPGNSLPAGPLNQTISVNEIRSSTRR